MKFFGRLDQDGQLRPLTGITVVATADEADALSAFFAECSLQMRRNPEWEHAHLADLADGNHPDALVMFSNAKYLELNG